MFRASHFTKRRFDKSRRIRNWYKGRKNQLRAGLLKGMPARPVFGLSGKIFSRLAHGAKPRVQRITRNNFARRPHWLLSLQRNHVSVFCSKYAI